MNQVEWAMLIHGLAVLLCFIIAIVGYYSSDKIK